MQDQQSASLRYFELLGLGSLALGVIVAGMQYNSLANSREVAALGGGGFVVLVQFIVLLVSGALILFISRKKSNIAKWIWIVLFVLGLPAYIPQLAKMFDAGFVGVLSSIQFLMLAAALYFLFQPDARQAMKKS